MKVGIICYNHFDATISLAKYLPSKSVKVEFVFLISKSSLKVEILNLEHVDVKAGFVESDMVSNVLDEEVAQYLSNEVSCKVFSFHSIRLADLRNYKLLLRLRSWVYTRGYDILHFVGNSPWIVLLNGSIRRIPKIHTLHEPYPFSGFSKYRLFRHKVKISMLLRTNSHITVPSTISYDRLVANFNINLLKVSITPFGVFEIYRQYLNKSIIKKDNVVLFYGNISRYKGIDVLIKAMEKVLLSNPNLKLVIAGSGSFKYDVACLGSNIEIKNKYLSNAEIADLNQSAAIVVCPYIAASQSGVVMTSFTFGNPIIATNVGALPEMIEDNITGVIIEPNNPDLLSKTILELFERPDKINELRQNVYDKYFSGKNSWANISEQMHSLYLKEIALRAD